jgi:hypothetical protein
MNTKYYSIRLYDTKEDGWNNNYIKIYTDTGIITDFLTLNYTDYKDNINMLEIMFDSADSKTLHIDYYNIGYYGYENYYEIYKGKKLIYKSDFGQAPEASLVLDLIQYNTEIIEHAH